MQYQTMVVRQRQQHRGNGRGVAVMGDIRNEQGKIAKLGWQRLKKVSDIAQECRQYEEPMGSKYNGARQNQVAHTSFARHINQLGGLVHVCENREKCMGAGEGERRHFHFRLR